MKNIKKIICAILTTTMIFGLTACASKDFDHTKLVDFCEDQDFEDCDEPEDFILAFGDMSNHKIEGEGFYINDTKGDAQDLYDKVVNRFNDYPSYDIIETTTFGYSDKGQLTLVFLLTFEETKDAEKFYKKYSRDFADDGESGQENGYSYSIEIGDGPSGKDMLSGVYLKGNTVLVIRSLTKDSNLVEDLCKAYKIISPLEA